MVGYLVATQGAKVLIDVPPEVTANIPEQFKALAAAAFRAKELSKLSVPVGLLSGLIAGWAYNRFSDIRLPSYLAFFGGRRFVPIVSGFAGLVLALVFGFGWQTLEHGMDAVSQAVLGSGESSACSPTACSIACSSSPACTTSSTTSPGSCSATSTASPAI